MADIIEVEEAGRELQVMAAGKDLEVPNPPYHELGIWADDLDGNYDFRVREMKMHRFPASLRAGLGDQYVVPLVVAIGPYHHGLPRLQEMERVKRMAAYNIITSSGRSSDEVHKAFLLEAKWARGLYYAHDAVAGMTDKKFAEMMFLDACFLLEYMVAMSPSDDSQHSQLFHRFLLSNQASIDNDIMLLENQLPWRLVELLYSSLLPETMSSLVETFVARLACTFQSKQSDGHFTDLARMEIIGCGQPHLLGIFRLYKMGDVRLADPFHQSRRWLDNHGGVSVPVSLTELAGFAIKLRPNHCPNLAYMGIRRGRFFDNFFMTPLYLDGLRACWLVNMAALELSTTSGHGSAPVCSYLALFAMLMSVEEDVHCARKKHFLRGELSDKQMLSFFNTITKHMSPGEGYFQILEKIQACKRRRWMRIPVQKFLTDHYKAIAAVLSLLGVLVGIIQALLTLNQHQP